MDVFKLQRMNSLAADLKKHNFATSSQDAFQQAEQVFTETPVISDEPQLVVQQKEDHLASRRFELLLEQNNKKYEQEIGLLRSALNSLAMQLDGLRSELHKMHEAPKKEQQVPLKTAPKEDHPRQGKFTSSDVDIQKMFYCGTKK